MLLVLLYLDELLLHALVAGVLVLEGLLDERKLLAVEQVQHHVAHGEQIVFPRGHAEVHLVWAGEEDVALELLGVFVSHVLVVSIAIFVDVFLGIAEVDEGGFQVFVEHDVAGLDVVVRVPYRMDQLDNVNEL